MKPLRIAIATVLFANCVCAAALEHPDRKIVIACPPSRAPMMADVVRAIEFSDYTASPSARRKILARAREECALQPNGVMTFVPPKQDGDAQLASK